MGLIGARQYWRVWFAVPQSGSSWLTVASIEMRGEAGGASRCSGGTVISSTNWYDSYVAANAFDGDPNTLAEIQGTPGWAGYRFAQPVEIVEVAIRTSKAWWGEVPRSLSIEYSDDGVHWLLAQGYDIPSFGLDETRVLAVQLDSPRLAQPLVSRKAAQPIAGAPQPHVLHNLVNHSDAIAGPSVGHHGLLPASRSREFWGYGRIEGKVTIEGSAASRRVRLFDERTALLVAEVWSQANGAYRFDFVDPTREYFVLAHDHVRQFNAVIADWVKPETFSAN